MHSKLLSTILGRNRSLFSQDINKNNQTLEQTIQNTRVLIIGAAGSIGSAFVKQIIPYSPASLHLLDISENELVEVVRDLRSTDLPVPDDFKTFAFAFGSLEFKAFLAASRPYDYIVNFSALKHVRSERDPYTLMRMLQTNVIAVDELLNANHRSLERFFSVSSDKSVNPVSLMGATKGFMERVMRVYSEHTPSTSARFANVAFSYGSLPAGFQRRLEKKQPIAAPSDVKRYFISHEEAGQLCLLACFLGNNRDVFFPRLSASKDLIPFSDIARVFLADYGLEPIVFDTEAEAKAYARTMPEQSRQWPCVFTQSDTTGEKMFEEFFAETDEVDFNRFQEVGVLNSPLLNHAELTAVAEALQAIRDLRRQATWTKKDLADAIKQAVPDTQHVEKGKNLDQKM